MEFVSTSDFDRSRGATNIPSNEYYGLREHSELRWKGGPGFGYSKTKARTFLENRYRRTTAAVSLSLKVLVPSDRFQSWVRELRQEGYLDWQILILIANLAVDFRVRRMLNAFTPQAYETAMRDLMNRAETEADLPFPEEMLYAHEAGFAKKANLISNAKIWGLVNRGPTPDFAAWKRMLNERYCQAQDDIEHADPFAAQVQSDSASQIA